MKTTGRSLDLQQRSGPETNYNEKRDEEETEAQETKETETLKEK